MTVYIVFGVSHDLDDYEVSDEQYVVGVYSSEEEAEKALRYCKECGSKKEYTREDTYKDRWIDDCFYYVRELSIERHTIRDKAFDKIGGSEIFCGNF